jgi:hypothetical protein
MPRFMVCRDIEAGSSDFTIHNQSDGCHHIAEKRGWKFLGDYADCSEAKEVAQQLYPHVDGCCVCCKTCHTGKTFQKQNELDVALNPDRLDVVRTRGRFVSVSTPKRPG